MTQTLTTLNISVQQIESDLRRGRTVQEIAQEWSEPVANVLAVKRAMDAARANGTTTAAVPPSVSPVRQVPVSQPTAAVPGHRVDESAITVSALVAAAARSTSKRTQALSVRLADLAKQVRDRLADERTLAEIAVKRKAEREKAAAEVELLEAQLRAARAKLRKRPAGGGSTQMPRNNATSKQAEAAARARAAAVGEFPCSNGCGKVATTRAGQRSHERHCTGGAS